MFNKILFSLSNWPVDTGKGENLNIWRSSKFSKWLAKDFQDEACVGLWDLAYLATV